jgi:hypothetical protein
MVTWFSADYGLSLRYPASWKPEQAEHDGVALHYFVAPTRGPERKPAASVLLVAGPLEASLDAFAQTYTAGNAIERTSQESRPPASGRSYEYASADGATRYFLLLVAQDKRVYGLFAQVPASLWLAQRAALEAISRSLTLERPASYPEKRDAAFAFAVRIPPSWRETRHFSGGGTLLLQYTSPPLAVDKGPQTVHASLTLTVEPLPRDGSSLDAYYDASRLRLGEGFKIVSHGPWQGGYVDVMTTESQLSDSRVKRFYAVSDGRGYGLAFEARADVYPGVSRWCDLIASTFRAGTPE